MNQSIPPQKKSQSKTVRDEKWDKRTTKQTENNTMAIANPSLSIITLKVNELYSTIKRHRVVE